MLEAGPLLPLCAELSRNRFEAKPLRLPPPKRRPALLAAVVVEAGLAVVELSADDLTGSSFFSSVLRLRLGKKPLLGGDAESGARVTDGDEADAGVVLRIRFTGRAVVVLELVCRDRPREEARLVLPR